VNSQKVLLVGDNPFHKISHFSQERTRLRDPALSSPENAANLIVTSLENGANGFMFSVSDTTLSILRAVQQKDIVNFPVLYAIVPYAYEYVTLATQVGGISGVAKKLAKQIVTSGNLKAMVTGLQGTVGMDLVSLMKTYLMYEIDRIRAAAGKHANIESMLLHEIITDMGLALRLDWLFKSYVDFMLELGITPGFNTCNLAYLVNRFKGWDIDMNGIVIATPCNKVGFQMNPSRNECEDALRELPTSSVIAISILAAGYLQIQEATDYVARLPNIKGVAVGVSRQSQARETFGVLRERMM